MPVSHYQWNMLIDAEIFGEENVRYVLEHVLSKEGDFKWDYHRRTRSFRVSAENCFSLELIRPDNGAPMRLSSVFYGEEVETGWSPPDY
ncbi:unnamed protein product [Clonostachys byssicola]|uniref:Uncharacterized protein n=1 Tax=Clonostachys byssicola TaxID=160290 RepID=A0A9N9U8X8_9HYPO|nr:unnamed protein product [Clonostachys byssicola]